MKTILGAVLLIIFGIFHVQNTGAQTKEHRLEKRQDTFEKTIEWVKNKQFIFVPNRALPQGESSINLTNNYGFIKIMDETTEGDMPFFGRAYEVPYGGGGGIKFKGEILNPKMEINEKKKTISFTFKVKDKDTFTINMDIGYDGYTSVGITSFNRSYIGYYGKTSPLKEEKE